MSAVHYSPAFRLPDNKIIAGHIRMMSAWLLERMLLILKCGLRAPGKTGKAQFAIVMPDRVIVFDRDVVARANSLAGPAVITMFINPEIAVKRFKTLHSWFM